MCSCVELCELSGSCVECVEMPATSSFMLLSLSFMLQSSNLQPDSLPRRIGDFLVLEKKEKREKKRGREKERRREGDEL